MKPKHTVHRQLSEKKVLTGLLQTIPNLALTEIAAICGYDFLILDAEHGMFAEMDHLEAMLTLSCTGVAAIVRLREHDAHALGRYLDMGADGILVPNVRTAQEAATLVRAMQRPPAGTRGCAGPLARETRYGMDLAAHLESPRAAFLAVMIETALGVANVQEIMAVDGVDAVVIGPLDLAADLGCPGDFSGSAYAQAVERIERAASDRGKIVGTAPHPGYAFESLVARGHRLITLGTDVTLIREAMASQLANARSSF